MKLVETNPLAENLEKGLGEIHWLFKGIYPKLRLRMEGSCGVASLAIAEHLREQGQQAELIISTPELSIDSYRRHVFLLVEGTVIDPAYSQFLGYAGLTPGYVMFGGKDYFPNPKIESFKLEEARKIADRLTLISQYVLNHLDQSIEEQMFGTPEFVGMEDEEMNAIFSEIWNPDNFDTYEPEEHMVEAGAKLAQFIVPEHVKLVA
jgi:hypothetical protein